MIGDKAGAATKNDLPPRIPHLVTAFLIRSTRVLSNPLDPLFKSISSFVLAKPVMDLFEVPEFLRLFHSNDVINHSVQQGKKILQVSLAIKLLTCIFFIFVHFSIEVLYFL